MSAATFSLEQYRQDHPQATPEECRMAHQEAIAEALHAQFLTLWDQVADRAQLAVLAGGSVQVGINIAMPDGEAPKPDIQIVH